MSVSESGRSSLASFFSLELLDNRYPSLHGLRVLAIVSVVQFHVTWIFAGEQGIVLDREWVASSLTVFFGMDLFFILSGFLIGSILLRSLETDGTQNLRRFYIRRISRTFPAYYVILTLLAVVTPLTAMQRSHLIWEYLYATNFISLARGDVVMFWGWSLALEEQFYLTVPLLFFVMQRLRSDRARALLLVALWSSALIMRLVLFIAKRPWTDLALYEALYFRPLTRFDTLIAGIFLAFIQNRWKEPISRFLSHPFHRALVTLPTLGCLWLLLRPWMFGKEHVQLVHIFAWGTVTSVMYIGWLLLLFHGGGFISDFLSAPIFRRVATLGYGVYLVHIPLCDHVIVPMARTLEARHVSMLLVWPLSLAALMAGSLGAGYLIHVLIEKPSLRIREWLAA
ncbi:acyltransferase 3 [Labilithrix luteola]|uniref:Acyltransferase 3 n=1 Tax=Labilithrix luteola TaxID=1391654 RepID=A0A0K1QCG7_9BACT|nr:acyltransferase [Labilithrix luteola]AKV03125.1 acyltransferase 3 [Labilithrix luteola]